MRRKIKEKELAIGLRKDGCSFKEIADKLKVSKGTLFIWLKGLILTDSEKENLKNKNNLKYILGFDKRRQKLASDKEKRISS